MVKKLKIASLLLAFIFLCSCSPEVKNTDAATFDASPADSDTAAIIIDETTETNAESDAPGETPDAASPSPTVDSGEWKLRSFIDIYIDGMSIEEQAAQMFIISLEQSGVSFTGPSDALREFLACNAGGYILFRDNITSVEGTRALTDAVREGSQLAPFIATDEEGGSVSRLYSARLPGYDAQPSAGSIGKSGDLGAAYDIGKAIGAALTSIGVNLNFAPVADVLTNSANTAIGSRSFGGEPSLVSDMALAFLTGLRSEGVMSCPKHFPGGGGASSDPHTGEAVVAGDIERFVSTDYKPFVRAIEHECEFIMVGHITAPDADPNGLPATLSSFFVTDELRQGLGFNGVIITDAMNMGAIAGLYSSGEAAVMAVLAGVDVILMPEDYAEAVSAVLRAVEDGVITKERVRESVTRILRAKIGAGLIDMD